MQGGNGQVSLQHQKVYTYWVDTQHNYIGVCFRWNPYLMQGIYALIILILWGIIGLYLNQAILTLVLVGIGAIAYGLLLKNAQLYYLLDERGMPTEFLSSQKPESIRRARPLTRKQFLKRVGEGNMDTRA